MSLEKNFVVEQPRKTDPNPQIPPRSEVRSVFAKTAYCGSFGAVMGGLRAAWTDAVPDLAKGGMTAFRKTATMVLGPALMLGTVGFCFSATDSMYNSLKGESDLFGSALSGAAGGLALGVMTGNLTLGLSAASACAVVSGLAHINDNHITPNMRDRTQELKEMQERHSEEILSTHEQFSRADLVAYKP
mmetsp:Transcript_4645/g.14203  ORF Transcript_4645/g.14203 Transcript_4645/m.14203 type:complete len:188 (-) Transcript_4645:47-610(-)|eukprot:CAMPEP_0177629456 /NCGR_PEP_ID=MMETSP0447-20121125/677_1 /TAXON_ID=0 /ORGANISM="Stygamoeba regulata, Strain BSH-02190019" /LENGTH=187 /DNA_ID=CAMNT_0019130777 /DNA_START=94 /DNA_END=660 /DNA_ORIENTATION=-